MTKNEGNLRMDWPDPAYGIWVHPDSLREVAYFQRGDPAQTRAFLFGSTRAMLHAAESIIVRMTGGFND